MQKSALSDTGKTREKVAEEIEAIGKARAKTRQGTRTDIVPNLAESSTGKTREKVAETKRRAPFQM